MNNPVPSLETMLGSELTGRAARDAQVALVLTDARAQDDPVVWMNREFLQLTGYRRDELVGRNCRVLQGPDTDRATVARLAADLRAGRTASATLVNHRKDGTPFWNRMIITPLRDDTGVISHHVGILLDVTDQVTAEQLRANELATLQHTSQRLDLLARVGDALTEHLDFDTAAAELARIAVPQLADWGYVAVFDDRGAVCRLHLAVRDPALAPCADRLGARDPAWIQDAEAVRDALASQRDDLLMPRPVDVAAVLGRYPPDLAADLLALGLGSVLAVPLFARDRTLGTLVLVDREADGFDLDAVVTAAHLGWRAGLALDNVRLYSDERAAALTLQHRLLPRQFPVDGLDVSASYLPSAHRSEVGGDWFDVLPLPDGQVALVVGDVAGHDMAAAASMGQVSNLLRARAWSHGDPGEVLTGLSEMLSAFGGDDVASCIYLRCARVGYGWRLQWANAGHPPALLRGPDGAVRWCSPAQMPPLGLVGGRQVRGESVDVAPGSMLVLYSDGLVERRDRPLREGLDLLAARVGDGPTWQARAMRDHLLDALVGRSLEDDTCLLVVRFP